MLNGLEYVKETIELRKSDIENNEFETNNLLLDDILIALGYNKRRELGVKAIYSGNADWEVIIDNDARFIVAVYGYNSTKPSMEQLNHTFDMAEESSFRFVILTDGERLSIYENRIEIVDIKNIFDDTNDDILNALSKTTWNPNLISQSYIKNVLTSDLIKNTIENNLDSISSVLIELLNLEITDETRNLTSDILNKLINIEDSVDKDKLAELTNEISNKDTIILELNNKIAELSNIETSTFDTNFALQEANDNIARLTDKLTTLEGQNKELSESINELTTENNNLKQQLSENSSQSLVDDSVATMGDTEAAYRRRIEELTEKNQKLTLEMTGYVEQLEEIKRKQAGAEDEKVVMARQLLDAVEDNPDLSRTYVGVVNSRLFQIGDLSKFVGTCLQELYSTVSFELMHLLFDGDIFKMIQPAVRNDLMINTKTYDIDISELSEEEVIARLKTLFSKFDKVIFMCKAIGTVKEVEYTNEYADLDEEIAGFDSIDTDQIPNDAFDDNFNSSEEYGDFEVVEGEGQDIDSQGLDEIQFDESPIIADDTTDKLLGLALCDIGNVMWSESNPIINISAISDGYKTFNIDNDTLSNIVNSGITAILSLCESPLAGLDTLHMSDLTTLSATIHLNRQEESDIQILDTNYYTNVDNLQKLISLLLAFSDLLNLDSSYVYMYFEATYNPESDLVENFVPKDFYDSNKILDKDSLEDCDETIHCILSGTSIDKIQSINGVLNAEKDVINNTIAVRTAYMTNALRSNTDIAKAVAICLAKTDIENVADIVTKINSIIPYEKNVIALEDEEVSEDAIQFTAGTNIYYIDTMPGYITTLLLFYLHKEINKDCIIDIRVELNSKLYTAYKNGIFTSNSSEYLASRLFVEITDGKTKVITK